MSSWARTPEGWAMNLDGSDGALAFSLPRLELRSTGAGWRGLHLLADGRRREWVCAPEDSLLRAKASAVAEMRRFTEPPPGHHEGEPGPLSPPAATGGAR